MKILVILPRFPYPLEKGDKLRAYNLIKALSVNNDISLFALSHKKVDQSSLEEMHHWCSEIKVASLSRVGGALCALRNLFSVRSLQIGYWDSRKALRQCSQFEEHVNPDVLFAQMIRTIKYAAHSSRPKVMDLQDALSLNYLRRMKNSRGLRYFLLHYEFKMLRSAEFNACSIFDALTIISPVDAHAVPCNRETELDVVANGVDFDYFTPFDTAKKYDVVFCGNMQYKPNIDAAVCLVRTIMPLVWKKHPQAKVLIAGATPKAAVRQLASERVDVSGTLPDIRPCYASSRVFAAPMRIGSGLQNKLLEAMSMGIPSVTTTVAWQSIGGQNGTHLLVADDPQNFADAIDRLLTDASLAESVASNASLFVRQNYSWNSVSTQLESILLNATKKHRSAQNIYSSNEETEYTD